MDRLRGFVGDVLDYPDWKDWFVHLDLIVIHPQYQPRSKSTYIYYTLYKSVYIYSSLYGTL